MVVRSQSASSLLETNRRILQAHARCCRIGPYYYGWFSDRKWKIANAYHLIRPDNDDDDDERKNKPRCFHLMQNHRFPNGNDCSFCVEVGPHGQRHNSKWPTKMKNKLSQILPTIGYTEIQTCQTCTEFQPVVANCAEKTTKKQQKLMPNEFVAEYQF